MLHKLTGKPRGHYRPAPDPFSSEFSQSTAVSEVGRAPQHAVGIGVIGCGYWGPNIIRNVANLQSARLSMVCDLSETRLRDVATEFPGLRTTTDYRELFEDPQVDAVITATPIRTHCRLATEALHQGKHVLVEKPLAASLAECEEMIEAAQLVGRVLMVGHTFQYNPAVQKLRELVRSGALGQIYYIDSARLNLGLFQRDINVMWDLAPHDISILMHVLGMQPASVSARGADHIVPGVDDLAQIDLHFPCDLIAHVRVSWLDPFKVRRVTVVGSRKMAVFDDMAVDKLKVYDKHVALRDADGTKDPVFDYHDGDVEIPALEPVEPLRAQIAHFVECIQNGRRPLSDGEMGRDVVGVIQAADLSRRQDNRRILLHPVEVPRLEVLAPTLSKLHGSRMVSDESA